MKRLLTTTAVIGLLAAPAGAFAQSSAQFDDGSARLWLVASKHLRGAQRDERPARKGARASKAKADKAIKTQTPAPIKVKPGDTLIGISRKTGVPVSELAKLNKLKEPYHVRIGSSIKLPPKRYYVVKGGDTLYSLARRFGVSADDLTSSNDIELSHSIRSGQKLYLPQAAEDSEAARSEPERKPEAKPEPRPVRPAPEPEPYARPSPPPYTPAPRTPPPEPYTAAPTPYSPAPVAAPPITSAPVEVGPAAAPVAAPTPAPEEAAPPPAPAPEAPQVSETQPLKELRPPSHQGGGLFGLFGHRREQEKQDQEAAVPPPEATPAPRPTAKPTAPSGFETSPARPLTPRPAPTTPAVRPAAPSATRAPGQMIPTSPPPSQSDVVTAGRGKFLWPTSGQMISGFGPKPDGQRNDGVNILAASGDPVRSAAAGEVVYAGNQVPSFGNLVLIKHPGGWVTAYAHLSNIEVKNRDQVSQGQQIGEVGQTGSVDRPQLHFEIRYAPTPRDKATPVDPLTLLPGR